MSSTNRGRDRHKDDYYVTPVDVIHEFLSAYEDKYGPLPETILDPAAGGDEHHRMSYPTALYERDYVDVVTMDIREDSRALYKGNYLDWKPDQYYGTVITNPPFYLAQEFAEKALGEAEVVILLQRINWLGSQKRKAFWDANPPSDVFVHHKRISFIGGATDSVEYGHFVWRRDAEGGSRLWVI